MHWEPPRIIRGFNDLLYASDDRVYIDLFSANGTTWLGHCEPTISEALSRQLNQPSVGNGPPDQSLSMTRSLLQTYLPTSHQLMGLYSTGMEAAEVALQLARGLSGRKRVIGFEGSMHGKSLCTSYLGWDNRDGIFLPETIRLPFVSKCDETFLLSKLETTLKSREVAALFIEPLQGSGGGHQASTSFHRQAAELCERFGTLLVFDEILTGFHRTGPPFMFDTLGVVPDIVLIGKALGNGFPISGVVSRHHPRNDLSDEIPTTTFTHPLAIAAANATLKQMQTLDLAARVAEIERIVLDQLGPQSGLSHQLRGKGAIWIIEPPNGVESMELYQRLFDRGVAAGCGGGFLRLLPPVTIDLERLSRACDVIHCELTQSRHS